MLKYHVKDRDLLRMSKFIFLSEIQLPNVDAIHAAQNHVGPTTMIGCKHGTILL